MQCRDEDEQAGHAPKIEADTRGSPSAKSLLGILLSRSAVSMLSVLYEWPELEAAVI
jgi:hypothetical protein